MNPQQNKELNFHESVKDILLKRKVLQPIDSILNHWILNTNKNDILDICHKFIENMTAQKIDISVNFPILVFSQREVGTDFIEPSEVKELNKEHLDPESTLVSMCDFVRYFSN